MITAKDAYEMIISTPDSRIDDFIETKLIPKFKREQGSAVGVAESELRQLGTKNYIKAQFLLRGFKITYNCDDRPCAKPYYEISIPVE